MSIIDCYFSDVAALLSDNLHWKRDLALAHFPNMNMKAKCEMLKTPTETL